jgi:hypothetical protein
MAQFIQKMQHHAMPSFLKELGTVETWTIYLRYNTAAVGSESDAS